MSLDITLLSFLRDRERYLRLYKAVPARALDARTQVFLSDFGRYFREFPEATKLDPNSFMFLFKSIHPEVKDENMSVYDALFKRVCSEDVDPGVEKGLLTRLAGAAAAYDLADLLIRYNAGEEVDLRARTQDVIEEFDVTVDRKIKNPQVLDPIEDLLKAEADERGFHWRLPCLNRHIKPLRAGDFCVIAARPDKGKTTFCASELTYMAAQVDALYPGENRSILWLNNEGPGRNIVTRCFQAAIGEHGSTIEELTALSNQPASTPERRDKYRTLIRERYADALGGRPGVLRIFDIHDMWNYEVEDLLRLYKPALVLYDMVDNIKFGGEANNGGQRTDQILEAMYQWARLMGVKYDCAMVATSQVSGDGDGAQYPTLPMLKDSKTGKQGAADIIITIGAVNDPMLSSSRYMGTTKNKRVRTGQRASPMTEVIFSGDRGRYVENPE